MTEAIGWALVQFLWQGALIAAGIGLLLALLPNRPMLRYAVACAGLAAMVLAVAVTTLTELSASRVTAGTASSQPSDAAAPVTQPGPGAPASHGTATQTSAEGTAAFEWPLRRRISAWLPVAVMVWGLGVTIFTLRLLLDWLIVQRLRSHLVQDATAHCHAALERVTAALAVSRRVRLMESALVDVPTAFGWIRPVILLPGTAITGLSPAELSAIIAHEVAHIRRHDYLVNIIQRCVESLLFYHPAVWWLSGRIRLEREQCCDDLAVQVCRDRVMYARALTTLESLRQGYQPLVLAASGASLLVRVQRLLGASKASRRAPTWVATGLAAAALALLITPARSRAAAEPQDNLANSFLRFVQEHGGDSRASVQDGRYRHPVIGVEFAVPTGWEIAAIGNSSDGGEGLAVWDPINSRHVSVWMIKEGTTLENIRAESVDDIYRHTIGMKIRMRFDQGLEDYWVPPNTIEERFINGRKALVATGRYLQNGAEMAERLTWIYSDQTRVFFHGRTALNGLPEFEFWFDRIAETVTIP